MKTGLKITLIAVGIAAIGSTVFLAGFGGMYYKKRAEEQYGEALKFVAEAYPYADLAVPADYVSRTQQGVTLMMPVNLEQLSTDPESPKYNVYFSEDKTQMVMYQKPFDFGKLDLAEIDNNASARLLEKFCRSMDREPLSDWYSYYDLIYHMTIDDCNIHSAKQAAVFESFAYAKSESVTGLYDTCWDWTNPAGDKGFIFMSERKERDSTLYPNGVYYSVLVELFDGNISYDTMIRANDLETCCRIANSVQIEK